MENFLYIIAMGFAGAYIAKRRRLNPFFWFAICSMLGIIGLLSFIFIPFFMKKQQKKIVPQKIEMKPLPFPLTSIWYYLDREDKQIGPMSLTRLLELKKEGTVQETYYIWNETFSEWKQWGSVFPTKTKEG